MPNFAVEMKTSVIIRFAVIGALWLLLVYAMLKSTPQVTLYHIFWMVASAIIIFVPMYKKYVKNGDNR